MSGSILKVLDHLLDVGPITSIIAHKEYGIGRVRFRGIIRELKAVVQIESVAVVGGDRRFREHRLAEPL
jgi:hypothetical protein